MSFRVESVRSPFAAFGRMALACAVGLGFSTVGFAQPSEELKEKVKFDKDLLFLAKVKDFTMPQLGGMDRAEQMPFNALAFHVQKFTNDELQTAARKDLSYADLMLRDDGLRENLRFELVRFNGKLKRLKRVGTYPDLKEAGIDDLCEAWIIPFDSRGVEAKDPIFVMLTQPPADIEPNEDISPGKPVVAAGYFFKIVQYSSSEPDPKDKTKTLLRRAPMLVGKTLTLIPEPPAVPGTTVVMELVPTVVVGALLLAILITALSFWLKRTDAGARKAAEIRNRNPFSDGGPLAPPES